MGFTYRSLSEKSGKSESTLKDWANHWSAPRNMVHVRTVVRVLGISLEFLLFGEEENPLVKIGTSRNGDGFF